ncbi:MAG: hypothetical protein WD071_08545 [Pseudohongiella sp.]|uniref:hypothetical protein n=1 Tax=Pseudohongiella sp. TaxID=1979412 RepID=UPI00349FD34C
MNKARPQKARPQKARPQIVSFVLAMSTLMAMSSAAAQQSVGDEFDESARSGEMSMFASAAQSISQRVGRWFGSDNDLSVPESAEINVDDTRIFESDLLLEAFPALSSADDALHLLDVSREHSFLRADPGAPQELDLSASYVWESPRFGQFILSTNTTYIYNTSHADVTRDVTASLPPAEHNAAAFGINAGLAPELQSSLTFTWQMGNHTATAVTSYADGMETFGKLGADTLNIEQLNELMGEIATLDLSYGYNVKAGRQGNASISVGVRSQFDRRQLIPVTSPASARLVNTPERMAYGTIKYQF